MARVGTRGRGWWRPGLLRHWLMTDYVVIRQPTLVRIQCLAMESALSNPRRSRSGGVRGRGRRLPFQPWDP